MRLHFINYHHNGDVHYSKEFMRDLYNIIEPSECFLHQTTPAKLIADMPFVKSAPPLLKRDTCVTASPPLNHNGIGPAGFIKGLINPDDYLYQNGGNDEDLYIVTWLAYYWFGPNATSSTRGCSLYSNYEAYQTVYDQLGILDQMKPIDHYVPTIDFSYFDKTAVNDFINDYPAHKIVMISNGDVWSGQSTNFDFTPAIERLCRDFEDVVFVLTHKTPVVKSNIFYTEDVLGINGCDLNEIGYLSTKCDVIVGRGSGPFCFAHTKDNYFDKEKVMVSFAHGIEDGFWYLPENGCHLVWSNEYGDENVYQRIVEGINYEPGK